jgi:hypothetical protein
MSWLLTLGTNPMLPRVNLILLVVLLARAHPQPLLPQVPKIPESQGITPPLPSSKYNILNQLANIKVDATLLDMVVIPEQQMHLKQFMEGKASVVANLFEEVDEEDSSVNKVGVHNFRYPVKKKTLFIFL